MLNRKQPYGQVTGVHEFNAAFEQFGKLYDISGYEIDKTDGHLLEGPTSPGWRGPAAKPSPITPPVAQPVSVVDAMIAQFGSREAAIAALGGPTPPPTPAPTGLSMQGLNNPPPPDADPQAGEPNPEPEEPDEAEGNDPSEAPAPTDIIHDGINLSAWARGELPSVEFMKVKPLIKEMFNKTPVNAAQAIAIINRGLPEG